MAEQLPDVTGVTLDSGNSLPPSDDHDSHKSSSKASSEASLTPPSEVTWEIFDTSLDFVSKADRIPSLCQFEEISPTSDLGESIKLSPGLKIFARQPVLIHTRCSKRQAHARTIYKDSSGAYYEVGQTLIVPEDYPGLFELVPSDFSRATCFLTIAAVANEMPSSFFTRSNIRGIRIEGEDEQQKYLDRKIPSGSVLKTNGIFRARWKTQAESGWLSKKKKEWVTEEVDYLRCIDSDNAEILVPFEHKGKFNAIYKRGQLSPNAVYRMKDILQDIDLPVKIRLLFGKAPVIPCIFTGMLIVREATCDEVVIGATVLNKRNVLFELPITAPITLKYTSSTGQLSGTSTYKDAQKLCKKYAHLYSSMIKLSPALDTDQKVLQHVPSDPMRASDQGLRVLDLITDISLTGAEPKDDFLGGLESADASVNVNVMPSGARLEKQSEMEYKTRESHSHV